MLMIVKTFIKKYYYKLLKENTPLNSWIANNIYNNNNIIYIICNPGHHNIINIISGSQVRLSHPIASSPAKQCV